MSTYKINNEQLTLIKEMPFKLEKEIQNIVERNLQTLLGLDFIKTEFSIGSFRIDSLAFDSEKKSFASNPQLSSSASFLRLNVLSSLN